jgi:choline dehydrogenase-like flavoprotein
MLIDALELPSDSHFETDVAVVGAGPAGITIARAFRNTAVDVCLVEAGGLDSDPNVQALYAGESTGIEYPVGHSRLRYFGGTSNHWGGFCRPLDEIDFEKRAWVPYSGWPFGREELEPYWGKASELVEVAPPKFEDRSYWRDRTGGPLLDWPAGRIHERFFLFSPPTRFGQRYRADLETASNIRVLLNANLTKIGTTEAGRAATHLALRTLSGKEHRVQARLFVLAAGGLENARILLLSSDEISAGLGNQNDLVGRFFMEHPHMGGFAELVVADLARLPAIYRDRLRFDGRFGRAVMVPTAAFLRKERLLNASFTIGVAGDYTDVGPADGLSESARSHTAMLRAARRFLVAEKGSHGSEDPSYMGSWLGVGCACEQVPNPQSRVTLASEKDILGLPKIRLEWRLTEQDRRSFVAHVRSLGQEFGALGVGRLRIKVEDDGQWPERVGGGSHHMGTTRMHDDPKQGVVDRDCRVHGCDNLFVAGSSVFPTSGSANPTINLVALALRLVDHLKERLS